MARYEIVLSATPDDPPWELDRQATPIPYRSTMEMECPDDETAMLVLTQIWLQHLQQYPPSPVPGSDFIVGTSTGQEAVCSRKIQGQPDVHVGSFKHHGTRPMTLPPTAD